MLATSDNDPSTAVNHLLQQHFIHAGETSNASVQTRTVLHYLPSLWSNPLQPRRLNNKYSFVVAPLHI